MTTIRKLLGRLILAGLALAGGLQAAELQLSSLPEINGYKVHPTRILARYRVPEGETLKSSRLVAEALARGAGMKIVHDYSLVPGLVLLDEIPGNVALAGVGNEERIALLKQRAAQLQSSGRFHYAHPDGVKYASRVPNDARFADGTLWGLQNTGQDGGVPGADINAAAAWNITTGTNTVIVASIDTGIRYTHADLNANMWVNKGEIPGNGIDDDGNGVVDDVYGFNGITGSGDPFDDEGHGSHTSGTMGAVANNGFPHVGVAWSVQLMACKFLSSQGFGFNGDAIKCLEYAVKMGAKVSNNSWGGGSDPTTDQALLDALIAAGSAGHLFVCAAGNSSANNDLVFDSPASYALPNMIAVAAIDRKDIIADFSNYGSKTVLIGAPGVDIFSTLNGSDTDYGVESGTSMASPHVAGVAALAFAAHPKADYVEVRERIINSAVPTASLNGRVATGGRVNAYNAVIGNRTGLVQLNINPPNGATLLVNSTNLFFVRATDILAITNATVSASITGPGSTNAAMLAFANNGAFPDATAGDDVYSAAYLPTNSGTYTFVFNATATGFKPAVSVTNVYTVLTHPANDSFATPTKIKPAGASFSDTNSLATLEPQEPVHGGDATVANSLWYSYTPVSSNPTLISTVGTGFPTVAAVYTGSALDSLTPVASAIGTSLKPGVQFTFNATKGVTYHIAVASASTNGSGQVHVQIIPNGEPDTVAPVVSVANLVDGTIVTTNVLSVSGVAQDPPPTPSGVAQVQISLNGDLGVTASGTTNWSLASPLNLTPGVNSISVSAVDRAGNRSTPVSYTVIYRVLPQPNDNFVSAAPLTGTNSVVKGSNLGATKEPGEPSHGGNQGGHSVWWAFTPPTGGILRLNTSGSSFDTLMGVYTGSAVGALTTLGENDDAYPGSGYSQMNVSVAAGVTVYIAVDGFSGATGNITLAYRFVPSPLLTLTLTAGAHGAIDTASGLVASNSLAAITALPDANYVFAGWSGSIVSFDNPLQLLVVSNLNLTANFLPQPVDDGFESGGLKHQAWTTAGGAPWFVETNVVSLGRYAVQSGRITNSQSSSLVLNVTTSAGLGSFDYKVSSEAGFDFLRFLVDGVELGRWSGEADWNNFSFFVTTGAHQFVWQYSKDATGFSGQDAAWLDNVQVNIKPPVTSASTAALTVQAPYSGAPLNKLTILATGQVGQIYWAQSSTNLSQWSTFATNINTLGSFSFQRSTFSPTNNFFRVIAAP